MQVNFGKVGQNILAGAPKIIKQCADKLETLPDTFETLSKNTQGVAAAVKKASGNWKALGLDTVETLSKNAQGVFSAVQKLISKS